MDIEYAVKQLDLEILNDEARLAEKKKQRDQLHAALNDEQKKRVDAANKPPAKK